MSDRWTTANVPSMDGRTVVITGANSGIGLEAARELARADATVVMACRSVDRGERAADEIRVDVGDPDLEVRECDLGDLPSVERFAESYRADHDRLDALVNNAGVMALPREETADGFERQFGVNHLGHFALTGRLIDPLAATDGARVVAVSSGAHTGGEIDFDDLQGERDYGKWRAYSQSKLANLLFAYELDRRADAAGLDVTGVGCHPGWAATDLQRRGPEKEGSRVKLLAMRAANAVLAQSATRGALPTLYAATEPSIAGGEYVGPGGLGNMRGYPELQASSDASYDRETARRLWEVSAELTGVDYLADAVPGTETDASADADTSASA